MVLLITGRPGAGKGTQAKRICNYYNIPHISTGDMFREAINSNSKLGLLAKEYIDKGELVPDDVTIGLVEQRISCSDCKDGFLLDGFPRTLNQAKALDLLLEQRNISLNAVININVDTDILIERLTGRRVCPNCGESYHISTKKPKIVGICDLCNTTIVQRKDDIKDTIINRLNVYDENTKPLLDFYSRKKLLKDVCGSNDLDSVFNTIINLLK